MENNLYIASDGTSYDITKVNTERLINSLAKHNRDIYNSNDITEFEHHNNQIALIDGELLRRNREFYDKKLEGGIWK